MSLDDEILTLGDMCVEKFSGATMGTEYNVQAVLPIGFDLGTIKNTVDDAVSLVDTQMSTFKPESDLCRFNRAPAGQWVSVPRQMCSVAGAANVLSQRTDGAFDITVFDAVDAWGFGPSAREPISTLAATPPLLEQSANYDDVEVRCNPPALRKRQPLSIDLSAIAKGFGVDEIGRVLQDLGCDNYLVEIAGEVLAQGTKPGGVPWIVGIELPMPGRRIVYKNMCLKDCALASSGFYRNFVEHDGKKYCHAIDPLTGRPVDDELLAVSVLMAGCMNADGMATALMVMGRQRAVAFANEHAIAALFIVAADGGFTEISTEPFALLADAEGSQIQRPG